MDPALFCATVTFFAVIAGVGLTGLLFGLER